MNVDPRHLELLRLFDEYGSVTAVADVTHRSPSAVSQQLRQASLEVGRTLVEPAGRGLTLTAAGRLLAHGGRDVARTLARVQAQWEGHLGEAVGEISLTGLPSALTYLLPDALRRLRQEHPAVELRMDDVDLAEHEFAGLTRDVDIVVAHSLVAERPLGTDGLTVVPLAREPIDVALAADHPLAGRASLTPDDVVGCRWVGVPRGYPFDTILTSIEHVTGRDLNVVQRIRDNRLIEAIVASSDQVALLPRFTTPRNAGLSLVPLTKVTTTRWIVAVMRPDTAERVAVRAVIAALSQTGGTADEEPAVED